MKIPVYLQENTKPQNTVKTYTQKLVEDDFFSENNIIISKHITDAVPHYTKYFLPILSHKKVKMNEEKYIILVQKKTSVTFYEAHATKNNKKNAKTCFESFKTLLFAINTLIKHQIVHFNICPNTVIFADSQPYIQDFSHSFALDKIQSERKIAIHRPPSWHVLCYITQNNLKSASRGVVDYVLQEYMTHAIEQGLSLEWEIFIESWSNFLLSKTEIQLSREVEHWDLFGLLILYLQLLKRLAYCDIFTQKFCDFLKKNISKCYETSIDMIISDYNVLFDE